MSVTMHVGAAVYQEGGKYGFEILQNGRRVVKSPAAFKTRKEAADASSEILSFTMEKIQEEVKVERMVRVKRDLPAED